MPDPITAVTAVAAILKIVDSVTGQWDRYLKKRAEGEKDTPHRVTTEQATPDTIVVKENGRPVETITADDLSNPDYA